MPNWKKVIVSGSDANLNSLNVVNGLTVTGSSNLSGSLIVSGSTNFVGSTGTTLFTANADTLTFTGSINISGSTVQTGSISATSFTGSLFGTASHAVTSSFITASNVFGPFGSNSVISSSFALTASYASFADNGGVTQILAGPNITVSPLSGKGQVTISSTGTGSGNFNTATGSYGSFYDTTTQINPVANILRSMSFNETAITNGVSISGSINPFNTYIKTEDAGVYNLQFSAQLDKTDSGTDSIDIWIRKNGIDLLDTGTTVTLTGNNDKSVAAWNWFVQSAANDYYQIIWSSADTDMRLLAEVSSSVHPGIPSVIATVNRVDQFLSNTGSFSGSFTGQFTGSLFGTASYATQALTASFAQTASFVTHLNQNVVISGSTTITGSLGVGTTGSAVVGRIDAANDVVAFSTSDENLKKNIKPIKNAIEKIEQIGGYTFDWKKDKKNIHGFSGKDVGVIAQEIEAVLPEVVVTRENGYKAVRYEKIIPLLIEAIKEQQNKINELENLLKQSK